jgi:hypothetical protein
MAYVYGHYKADTGELFYIGKGIGKRAWSVHNRNLHWKSVVRQHGFTVKILHEGLTEEDAYKKEIEVIAEVGLQNLTNVNGGGKGLTSEDARRMVQSPEWRKKNLECVQRLANDPEWRKKNSDGVKRKFQEDAEYKRKHAVIRKQLAQDNEYKQKMASIYSSAEWKEKQREGMKRMWAKRKQAEN